MLTAGVILAGFAMIGGGATILCNVEDGVEFICGTAMAFFGLAATAVGFIAVFNGGF